MSQKLPVTVLSSFLAARKTTTLNHALADRQGLRVAEILNDMSEVTIVDRMAIEHRHATLLPRNQQ